MKIAQATDWFAVSTGATERKGEQRIQPIFTAAAGNTIWIDDTATGLGWFIDSTPWDAEEFDENGLATAGSDAEGRIDLLTAVLHELGHLLGLDHDDELDSLMSDLLAASVRRSVSAAEVDAVLAAAWDW